MLPVDAGILSQQADDWTDRSVERGTVGPLAAEHALWHNCLFRNVTFTEDGNDFIERRLTAAGLLPEGQSLYDPESTTLVHHVTQALKAHMAVRNQPLMTASTPEMR